MPDQALNIGRSLARKVDELRGLVWFEVYVPVDLEALTQFVALMKSTPGGTAVEAAELDPELAQRALTPIDSQGEAMRAEDLILLAHRWLTVSRRIDADHDKLDRPTIQAVESFVNGPEVASPNFSAGAWVVVFQFDLASEEWQRFLNGDLTAVSFMAHTDRVLVTFKPLQEAA